MLLTPRADPRQQIPEGVLYSVSKLFPGGQTGREGVCALQIAASKGRTDVCTILLTAGESSALPEMPLQPKSGATPALRC